MHTGRTWLNEAGLGALSRNDGGDSGQRTGVDDGGGLGSRASR